MSRNNNPGGNQIADMRSMLFNQLTRLSDPNCNLEKDEAWLAEPKMKIADQAGKISVRIDAKTIVLVAPGTDVEKYKKEYLKRKLDACTKAKKHER